MMLKISLPKVNRYIQTKYQNLEIVKGQGYFYVTGKDEETALKVAGMYCSSIYVYKVNDLSLQQWVESVDQLIKDDKNEMFI